VNRRPEVVVAALVATAAALTFLPAREKTAYSAARGNESANAKSGRRAKVGLVFDVGGRGDKSFNDAAYAGLERAKAELDVDVSYLEPVGSEDREAALRLFAARGFDLVIGVGFIFSSDVDAVARAYPKAHFACVDYAPSDKGIPPNVTGLEFREEQGSFLVGAAAGLLTKSGHVGFVGGMSTPLIRKFEAGYEAGVKATCVHCTLHAAYVGASPEAFHDPAKGKALAISQIAAGADVLYHASGSSGHGVFEAAHDAKVLGIGVDSDQYEDMPSVVVTSMIKRVDVAVFEAIARAVRGEFHPGLRAFGLAEGGVDYVHDGPHAERIPDAVKARVAELREEVVRGAREVPFR
jgi:basic membrane protein A